MLGLCIFLYTPFLWTQLWCTSRSTDSSLDTVYEWQYTRMDMVKWLQYHA